MLNEQASDAAHRILVVPPTVRDGAVTLALLSAPDWRDSSAPISRTFVVRSRRVQALSYSRRKP